MDKARKRYVLSQPVVPVSLRVPTEMQARMQRLQAGFARTHVQLGVVCDRLTQFDAPEQAQSEESAPLRALRHPLGEIAVSRLPPEKVRISWRSGLESQVLEERCAGLLASLEAPDEKAFATELRAVAAMARGEARAQFREGDMRAGTDAQGWAWQFPPRQGIPSCLRRLHSVLHQRSLGHPWAEATVAYGILNWMHAFTDGNGRTSRIVFNALLRRDRGMGGHYLPIKEINHMARGGHEIRLRYSIVTGEWEELLGYFLNAAEFYQVVLHHGSVAKQLAT